MVTDTEQDFSRCLHGKAAPCMSACPLGVDVRQLNEKIARGSFGPAYNLLRTAAVFPGIISQICPAFCRQVCGRCMDGKSINVPLLERAACAYARNRDPQHFTLPDKKEKIAVFGSDLGALACALRLAEKKYSVTVLTEKDRLLSSLEDRLSRQDIEEELALQFKYASCGKILSAEPVRAGEWLAQEKPDAVCVSADGEEFFALALGEAGLAGENKEKQLSCFHISGTGELEILRAGTQTAADAVWLLETGNRRVKEEQKAVSEVIAHTGVPEEILPADGIAYLKPEARKEADRCRKCECSLCIDQCVLLQQYGMTPQNLARDASTSVNLFEETQGHAAMREIASCNDCGMCAAVCPAGLDIGKMLLDARSALYDKGALPPAHHEYWLRDMGFADSKEASLCYLPAGQETTRIFFPGCQAGGSDPRYVSQVYQMLRDLDEKAGIVLECCGASALWAGDQTDFHKKLSRIHQIWKENGRPEMVLICPSCYRIFRENLPDLPVKMFFELDELKMKAAPAQEEMYIFDPCGGREYPELENKLRSRLKEWGLRMANPEPDKNQPCCSWGGHGYKSNPLFVTTLRRQSEKMDERPYLCWCTNCRDVLSHDGKVCRHILDLFLDINREERSSPTISERRENRRRLKQMLIRQWKIRQKEEQGRKEEMPALKMSEEVKKKLDTDLILEEELGQVISNAMETKRYLIDQDTGHYISHQKIGYVTYWVEFGPAENGAFPVYNAYSHRMEIRYEDRSEVNP